MNLKESNAQYPFTKAKNGMLGKAGFADRALTFGGTKPTIFFLSFELYCKRY